MSEAVAAIDRIRQTELAAARRVEEAREQADVAMTRARAESAALRSEARRRGRELAQRHLESSIAVAEAEAERVRAAGEAAARELLDSAKDHIDAVAAALVRAVLAPPVEEGK